MTLSRLELGFESPWGRHLHQTGDTVECRDCREGPKIKGSRFFVAFFLNWYGFRRKGGFFQLPDKATKLLEWKSVRHTNTTSEPELSLLSNNTKTPRQKAVERAKSLSLALSNAVVSVETIQNNEALASFSSPQFPSSKNPNEAP